MTEQVNPSLGRGAGPFETAGAFAFGAHGDDGWISPPNDPTDISVQSERIDESYLYAFDESHSSTSFTVDVEGGEAFVFGAWMAKDATTGVYIGANSNETIYAGWDKNKGNNIIVGYSADFSAEDKKIPLWQAKSDGTGVYSVDDLRTLRHRVTATKLTTRASSDYTTDGEGLIHTDTSGGSLTLTLASADVQKGKEIIVSDTGGAAGSNPITIATEGTETINGKSSVNLSVDYGGKTLYSDGNNWFVGPPNAMSDKRSETGVVGGRVYETQPESGGAVNVATTNDAYTESRSGTFGADGVPEVERGNSYEDILVPNERAEVYMWNPGPTVQGTIPEPSGNIQGTAYDGSDIWAVGNNSNYIYSMDKSGSVTGGFSGPAGNATGVTWDGSNLWISDIGAKYIYQMDKVGNVTGGFSGPANWAQDLSWDGSALWHVTSSSNAVYRLDTNGDVLDSFENPGGSSKGVLWDGSDLWFTDPNAGYIYKANTSGGVVGGFSASAGPLGICWDGEQLINASQSSYIYKYSDSYDYSAGVIN